MFFCGKAGGKYCWQLLECLCCYTKDTWYVIGGFSCFEPNSLFLYWPWTLFSMAGFQILNIDSLHGLKMNSKHINTCWTLEGVHCSWKYQSSLLAFKNRLYCLEPDQMHILWNNSLMFYPHWLTWCCCISHADTSSIIQQAQKTRLTFAVI